jgi:group I intron endonuclease
MAKKPLIYVGRCLPTNKVYVGSTTQGKRRVFSHTRDLSADRHSNKYPQHAWVKYGSKSFVWHVVEECTVDDLLEREQWWIGFLRADDRRYGFNLCHAVNGQSDFRTQLALTQVEKWRDPEIRRKRLIGLKALHKDQAWKSRRAEAMAARWKDPTWRARMLNVLAKNVESLVDRNANEPGFKQHRMRGIQAPTGRV